jgi:hypothetical protein
MLDGAMSSIRWTSIIHHSRPDSFDEPLRLAVRVFTILPTMILGRDKGSTRALASLSGRALS